MNPILAIVILLFIGLCLYGVWYLVQKLWPGVPAIIIGIVLILVFLLIGLHLFGVYKVAQDLPAPMQKPTFRHAVVLRLV